MATDDDEAIANRVADAALSRGHAVVAAESVTAGAVAHRLASGHDASTWFCGSFVTYRTDMKRRILGVRSPELVSAECAREMAAGALKATAADVAVAVTGAGGPDPVEGRPPGTVFICVATADNSNVFEHHFDGDPAAVVEAAARAAVRHLLDALA